jgi:hypothetical protein
MERDPPRWRVRIRTFMPMVVILSLALALVGKPWKGVQALQRRLAEMREAEARAAAAQSALAQSECDAKVLQIQRRMQAQIQEMQKQPQGKTNAEAGP